MGKKLEGNEHFYISMPSTPRTDKPDASHLRRAILGEKEITVGTKSKSLRTTILLFPLRPPWSIKNKRLADPKAERKDGELSTNQDGRFCSHHATQRHFESRLAPNPDWAYASRHLAHALRSKVPSLGDKRRLYSHPQGGVHQRENPHMTAFTNILRDWLVASLFGRLAA